MIARNEARCISRCLQSAKPWVDELIVLDTGSTDETVRLASDCGARVEHFSWCDDFAKARNAALAHSTADWNLILDADEWIEGRPDCLSRAALAGECFLGVAEVQSSFDAENGTSTAVSWISRLLPRGVYYQGRVHEQPVSRLPRRRISLVIGHDGYGATLLAQKSGRNFALLQQELKESPSNAYVLYQLGKDCEVYQRFEEACFYYRQAQTLAEPSAAYSHGLIVRFLHCLGRSGHLEEAIYLASEKMAAWQHSPDFFFVMGNLLLDYAIQEPARALAELLPMAEACWQKCLDIGETPNLDDSVQGRGSYLATHNLAAIRGSLK